MLKGYYGILEQSAQPNFKYVSLLTHTSAVKAAHTAAASELDATTSASTLFQLESWLDSYQHPHR